MTLFFSFLLNFIAADTVNLQQHLSASTFYEEGVASKNVKSFNEILKKNAGKSTVFKLPVGKIWINASILIPDHTTIAGDDKGSEMVVGNARGDFTEGILVNVDYSLGNATMNHNISLVNFTINGNNLDRGDKFIRGVFFNKVSNVFIHKLTVLNTTQEGIRVDVNNLSAIAENIEISDCFVSRRNYKDANIIVRSIMNDGANSAFWPSRVKNIVIKNNFSEGGVYGICLSNVSNVQAYNNTCISNFWRGIIVSPTCVDVLIKKNRIDSAGSTGIHIAFYGKNIIIDSNTVSNTLQDMSGKGYEGQGIKCYVGFSNLTITNNISYNNATDGIAIEGGADGRTFLIENNTVNNNKRHGIRLLSGPFVINKGGNIRDGKIKNNTASGNQMDAFSFTTEDKKYTIEGVTLNNNKLINAKGFKKVNVGNGIKVF
ncbi:MAG: right-handed parallel beta-helix repeat-containing protein [Bacteroidia bacterium]|nr:right-handed parallel beta-helix repeat-containing protein [Bacteroidia bacterium]